MTLDILLDLIPGAMPGGDDTLEYPCQLCGAEATARIVDGQVELRCPQGCSQDAVLEKQNPQAREAPRGSTTGGGPTSDRDEANGLDSEGQVSGRGGSTPSAPTSADVAQWIEQPVSTGMVAGSTPALSATSASVSDNQRALMRPPPQAIQAEQGVLGAILIANSAEQQRHLMRAIAEIISADDFYRESHRLVYRSMLRIAERGMTVDAYTLTMDLQEERQYEDIGGAEYIANLAALVPSASAGPDYARIVHEKAALRRLLSIGMQLTSDVFESGAAPRVGELVEYVQRSLANVNGHQSGEISIIVETQDQSLELNKEYLARPEIIEGLGYSQSIMLVIGGKHAGKTTNIRTLALCEARGLPIWGRATAGGPVIYAASDDEIVSTRNELLQMGWRPEDPLYLVRMRPDGEAARVLQDIGDEAVRAHAVLIIVDMLFDFIGIKDEMSYAGTREAINALQHLADRTHCLVIASHHTPKYLNDAHNAANAALGSQGISARFSPIVLVRKWTEQLFTVESTTTRDPRGKILAPQKIVRNEAGWIETAGEFKEWMKWQVYAERVMGLFEGGDPRAGYAVSAVAEKLEIDRARAQNALFQLTQEGKLVREKTGRSYRYYLPSTSMFDREGGQYNEQE